MFNLITRAKDYYFKNDLLSLLERTRQFVARKGGERICPTTLAITSLSSDQLRDRYNYYILPKETPFTIEGDPHEVNNISYLLKFNKLYKPTVRTAYEIPNGIIAGHRPLAFTPQNKFIPMYTDFSMYCKKHQRVGNGSIGFFKTLTNNHESNDWFNELFLLAHYGDHNYHHWITWFLPQFRTLRHYELMTGERPQILVQNNPPDWMLQSIKHIGIDLDRCIEWNRTPIIARKLIVPNLRVKNSSLFDISIEDCNWIRNKTIDNLDQQPPSNPRNIYISRKLADTRHVENYRTLENTISNYNFETYCLENLTFRDQVRLFSEANCILGPHGAGLTNILFAPEGTQVIELMPDNRLNAHYYLLSKINNHDYDMLLCDYLDNNNIFVNIPDLKAKLECVTKN